MALTSTARRATGARRASTVLVIILLVGAGCGGTSTTTTAEQVASSATSSTITSDTAPPTTETTTTEQTTTTAASTVPAYSVAKQGAGIVPSISGDADTLGSGCVPGEGPLPDGIWFGWAAKGAGGVSFDQACLADGAVPTATNSNPKLRDVAVTDDTIIRHRDGSTAAFDEWSPTTEPVWVYINDGIATEIAYFTADFVMGHTGDGDWGEATVNLPVGGGCCGEMYSGPTSPDDPWPPSGLPADGVYGVVLTLDLANDDLVLEIRKFIACVDRPDLCNPDYLEGDVALNHEDEITRRVALDEDLTVRLMGIHVDSTIDPNAVNAIEGSGAAFAQLLADNAAAFESWVQPQLDAGDDYQDIYEALALLGADDAAFPYTKSLCCDADWSPLIYRGPLGVELVEWLYEPNGFIGPVQLEIVNGLPVLIIDGGRIAG